MAEDPSWSIEVAPSVLGESLSAVRLCAPQAQQRMRQSLSTIGQLTPVQAYRIGDGMEVFDGLKRTRAARELDWPTIRVELHALDAPGAKARLLRCNQSSGLSELEEAWLVRSLYREDRLSQPQIAQLLSRHKSWVCRRLAMAEDLSDEVTASVRLGLVSATVATELARLQRCNQDPVAQVVTRRGLTTRQTARLVEVLLSTPPAQWPRLLEQVPRTAAPASQKRTSRRTPGEHLVADASAMKGLAVRLQTRLLTRSLQSLGEPACATVGRTLAELATTLRALTTTLDARLDQRAQGEAHATT